MTDHAIISGSLVDVRNVGTHKSVKLTIHVPEEYATRVVDAFGWPTGANPVAVAIAALNEGGDAAASGISQLPTDAPPRQAAPAGADKPKSPAQVAGFLCTVPAFQKFLSEKYRAAWNITWATSGMSDAEHAAACVRELCKVDSRADLTDKNTEWASLRLAYQLWLNEPDLVA